MFKGKWGKILITFIIVSSTVISVVVDWNHTHVFNPEWPGHARYHGLLFLNLLCGVSILSLWLMWRQSKEPELGVRVAVLILVIYRASFFYLSFLPPHTSLLPRAEEPPHFHGLPIYPNVVASGIFIILILLGYWIYRRERLNAQG
jgi:hypothetical protein